MFPKSKEDEKTKKELRDKRDELVREKNRIKKQLKAKKEYVKKLENRSISKKRKKEIAKVPFIYYVSTYKGKGVNKKWQFFHTNRCAYMMYEWPLLGAAQATLD